MKIRKIRYKNKDKKAQLKIQEMSFMLLAVVLFFILAGLFYLSIQYRDIHKKAVYFEKEKSKSSVRKLAETAEFTCGKPLCVDADKLMAMRNRAAYNEFWPVKSIEVRKVFPSSEEIICNKNNYPNCSIFEVYDSKIENIEKVSSFVALCRKEIENNYVYDKCELGKMVIGFEVLEE